MFTPKRLVALSLFMFALTIPALAQQSPAPIDNPQQPVAAGPREPVPSPPLVTATATAKRVRFVSPGTVVQLRLEVYNLAGQKLFDTELHGGNVLDWHLQDGAGERLPAGSYASVLTIKSLSGRMSQRVGVVTINDEKAAIEPAEGAQLSMAQLQTIGPVEGNAAFTVVQPSETEAITAVTHDGADGQVSRTRGALSFRVGDVFAGKDKEQMRLTEAGRLGIGTSDPQANLDVAGTIRAERVVIARPAKPGSTDQMLAAETANATGIDQTLATGSGTQDRIAKWTDNAGTLGDSTITEVAGRVGIGVTSPSYKLVVGPDIGPGLTTSELTVSKGAGQSVSAFVGASGSNGMNFGWDEANLRAFVNAPVQSPITFTHGGVSERIRIATDGKVGIGTNSPGEKLDVVGNIRASGSVTSASGSVTGNLTVDTNTLHVDATNNRVGVGTTTPGSPLDVVGAINSSTQYNIGGNRVLSTEGTNLFAGVNAGASNSGAANSFFGNAAGLSNTTGSGNSLFGSSAGAGNTEGASNSFFGSAAGLSNTTGNQNSFFGNSAGLANTTASNNSFFGKSAGQSNTFGEGNSFFGSTAGAANTTGFQNSFFGINAGTATTTGASNSFFGSLAGRANTTGNDNAFFGVAAGIANTTGSSNSFFGVAAGNVNTAGISNSFFGRGAGAGNTTGFGNSFFGENAGSSNTTASTNSFFGRFAGANNTTGAQNSFFGSGAGSANTTGSYNAFFGDGAGQSNTTPCCNSFFGAGSGFLNTTGSDNAFFGNNTGFNNTTGSSNSFFGRDVGYANTTGFSNSFFGNRSGNSNTTGQQNSFFGKAAGEANTTGVNNSLFGYGAGTANTTGNSNSFFGNLAGVANTTGASNSFFGESAGQANTTGTLNSFFGALAGQANTTGLENAFFGNGAGTANTSGVTNSFFGTGAGAANTTGFGNILIGYKAGRNTVAGTHNIYIANDSDVLDVPPDESNHIRIGLQGGQTATFIAGISGTPVAGDAVFVDANGQLGIGGPSSRRFKQDIGPMGAASNKLMQLRPVVFHYRPEFAAGTPTLQYGLIAEEVARVFPELVGFGADRKPQTVRYHLLNTLLLNEVQKQETHIQAQTRQLQNQAQQIADLEARLRRLESQTAGKRRLR